ncbi:MAG: hypothetical protein ABI884_06900, partial [Gemmatimonadota bacterium]
TASTAPGAAPAAIAESSVRAAGAKRIESPASTGIGMESGSVLCAQALASVIAAVAPSIAKGRKGRGIERR